MLEMSNSMKNKARTPSLLMTNFVFTRRAILTLTDLEASLRDGLSIDWSIFKARILQEDNNSSSKRHEGEVLQTYVFLDLAYWPIQPLWLACVSIVIGNRSLS